MIPTFAFQQTISVEKNQTIFSNNKLVISIVNAELIHRRVSYDLFEKLNIHYGLCITIEGKREPERIRFSSFQDW